MTFHSCKLIFIIKRTQHYSTTKYSLKLENLISNTCCKETVTVSYVHRFAKVIDKLTQKRNTFILWCSTSFVRLQNSKQFFKFSIYCNLNARGCTWQNTISHISVLLIKSGINTMFADCSQTLRIR